MLTLEYSEKGDGIFKAVHKKTIHLEKMGFSLKDERFLHIEEVLYLVENGLGRATKKNQDEDFSLAHLYLLLSKFGISQLKYALFCEFIRAGYIVKRAQKEFSHDFDVSTNNSSASFIQYRILVLDDRYFNKFPSPKRLCEISNERPDHGLLIGYGNPMNICILKYNVESDESLKLN